MELFDHLPKARILEAYAKAAGRELDSKAESPESSSALVANTFGYFVDRPEQLPPLQDLDHAGWPAQSLALEANVRFPWSGGHHPWLDVLVETSTHTVGIESKRFEPYRGPHAPTFSDAYDRDVWSPAMRPYLRLMWKLRSGLVSLDALDASQLIKHALALSTRCGKTGKQPVLCYLYADPRAWPDGRLISDQHRAHHLADVALFSREVAGASVSFVSSTYAQLLSRWLAGPPELRNHARAVAARFFVTTSECSSPHSEVRR